MKSMTLLSAGIVIGIVASSYYPDPVDFVRGEKVSTDRLKELTGYPCGESLSGPNDPALNMLRTIYARPSTSDSDVSLVPAHTCVFEYDGLPSNAGFGKIIFNIENDDVDGVWFYSDSDKTLWDSVKPTHKPPVSA